MQDFEKLGVFYLGRSVDPRTGSASAEQPLLYDSRDLTTHAVCVGMTGSGKTGLCVSLLEEAAIDGIPAIAIDPKGDLGNILLAFPELRSEDFRPWVDDAEATRQGVAPDALAAQTAEAWRKGLADWGQDVARIGRLKAAVDMAIYTPGSTAGRPLGVLRSFAAPPPELMADSSAVRDRVMGAVSGLLGLVGISADPLRSREHILLSTIIEQAWREGRSLDLAALIQAVQKPPFATVGVFDLETFFPAADRLGLAMALNNLVASPGFSAWMQGEPLDIQRLLYTPEGKPRLSVISIAHLSDSERMFFVTLLLNEVLAWMRTQSGTSSLRAILYMDEIFGYFPPTAVPPSKPPMLTLLKQARAFGVGVVLATQNPVDLDYKGLANAGTWLIGRLQTERDRVRLIEGLEGAQAEGGGFDRQEVESMLARLGNRMFLMRNVHDDRPVLFQSRWALSYLRGPMTLVQIQRLMAGRPAAPAAPAAAAPAGPAPAASEPPPAARPVVPAGVREYFLRAASAAPAGAPLRAAAVGLVQLHFVDAKAGVDTWAPYLNIGPFSPDGTQVLWDEADVRPGDASALDARPPAGVRFEPLPAAASRGANYAEWQKALKLLAYQTVTLDLLQCPAVKLTSRAGESEGDFRVRASQALRERRDAEVEKVRARYAPKLAAAQEQLRRADARIAAEKSQLTQQTVQTVISVGATILGAFFGRKAMSVGNLGRATTAARGASRTMREQGDVARAGETREAVQQRYVALQQELEAAVAGVQAACDPASAELTKVQVRPRKSDIVVSEVALGWVG